MYIDMHQQYIRRWLAIIVCISALSGECVCMCVCIVASATVLFYFYTCDSFYPVRGRQLQLVKQVLGYVGGGVKREWKSHRHLCHRRSHAFLCSCTNAFRIGISTFYSLRLHFFHSIWIQKPAHTHTQCIYPVRMWIRIATYVYLYGNPNIQMMQMQILFVFLSFYFFFVFV